MAADLVEWLGTRVGGVVVTASPLNVSISFAAIVDAGDEEQVCLFLAEKDPLSNTQPKTVPRWLHS